MNRNAFLRTSGGVLAAILFSLTHRGAVPLAARPRGAGAQGVNEGSWQVKIMDGDRSLGLDFTQFDSHSIQMTQPGATTTQINISAANDKGERNLQVMLIFPGHDKGTFDLSPSATPKTHLQLTTSDLPQPPDAPFFVVKEGTLTVENYPPVGALVKGHLSATCEWQNLDMKPVKTIQVDIAFSGKRIH